MHQRKGKKILIYFLLLILVGSINNVVLNNIEFEKIKNIQINGLGKTNNLILKKKINNINLGNIFFVNDKEISEQIVSNNLVEKYEILKKYPSSLIINIKKTKFLARINDNGKIMLVGSNGKLSKNDNFNNQLPFIFGNPKIIDFLKFKKIIDGSKIPYNNIKSFYFFASKRWDIELKNNTIIKLPSNYPKDSLQLAFKFLNNKDPKDIKIVDARIKNQIILND